MADGWPCRVCSNSIGLGDGVIHHISYNPPITVLLHRGCHAKVHASRDYPFLKPSATLSRDLARLFSVGPDDALDCVPSDEMLARAGYHYNPDSKLWVKPTKTGNLTIGDADA